MATLQKSTIDVLNIQGTTEQLATVKATLTSGQRAIFTATDKQRMYLVEAGQETVMLGSNVEDASYDPNTGYLKITLVQGGEYNIKLSIDDELSSLQETILAAVAENYLAKDDFVTDVTENANYTNKVPSAALVKGLQTRAGNIEANLAKKVGSVTGNLVNNADATNPTINFYAEYNSNLNRINFFAASEATDTVLCYIDATDFVYKGMIDDVRFDPTTKELTIDFNTNAGKTDITIDMTSLVDTYTAAVNGGLTLNGGAFSIDTEWLQKNTVTSIFGLEGKIETPANGEDEFYWGASQTNEDGVELPYPSVRFRGTEKTESNGVHRRVAAFANPVNILANLAYLIQNHPDLVTQLSLKGISASYNETEGVGTLDAHPKWYTIVE